MGIFSCGINGIAQKHNKLARWKCKGGNKLGFTNSSNISRSSSSVSPIATITLICTCVLTDVLKHRRTALLRFADLPY